LEQVVSVGTRKNAPESWAITQMNLGLALSRLPASDAANPHVRAVEALREAMCSANWAKPRASGSRWRSPRRRVEPKSQGTAERRQVTVYPSFVNQKAIH